MVIMLCIEIYLGEIRTRFLPKHSSFLKHSYVYVGTARSWQARQVVFGGWSSFLFRSLPLRDFAFRSQLVLSLFTKTPKKQTPFAKILGNLHFFFIILFSLRHNFATYALHSVIYTRISPPISCTILDVLFSYFHSLASFIHGRPAPRHTEHEQQVHVTTS